MKNLFLFLLVLLAACQSNQNAPETSDTTTPTAEVTTKTESKPKSITKLSVPDTAYVTAKSGLRVRNQPNLDGERIGVRPYAKKVLITERTGLTMTIKDEGKDISGEWVGIESRLVSKGKIEMVTGYLFSGFLSTKQPVSVAVNLANFSNNMQYLGIGGLVTNLSQLPDRPQPSVIASDDTLRLYSDDLKTVSTIASHWFLANGNKRYVQVDQKDCRTTKDRISFSSDLGLGDFAYVKTVKSGFAYLGKICGKPAWINLKEMNPKYAKLQSHIELFQSKPKGGGWEHGYTYVGPNKVLRAQPKLDAKAIVNKIPADYEIYLLGPVKGNWAKVKLREAKQIFGEMYFEKSVYGKTWEGWIMIVEPDGTPLMEPHIFGC